MEKSRDSESELQPPKESEVDFGNLSLIESLQGMDSSFTGTFDSEKISSVFEPKESDEVHLKNIIARSGKRLEAAIGLNLVNNGIIELKPVNNTCNFLLQRIIY